MSAVARSSAPREKSANKAWLRALELTAKIDNEPSRTFPVVVEELGAKFGTAPAIFSTRENFTHAELAARANAYARWALAQGIGKGDVVALLMPNRAEYLAIWLGITRIGGIVALINTNLTGQALAHCVAVASPKHVILAPECSAAFDAASSLLRVKIWRAADAFLNTVGAFSGGALKQHETRAVTLNDPALLIYTSGTTGLPKAAYVSHHRIMMWTHWFAGMMDARADDRLYNCLPMYHSVGGVVASGAVLVAGGSVVVREKFSARAFWSDVAATRCTIFQYIGELCRYLLKAEAPPIAHSLRLCCGNGLSGDIWTEFQQRFAIPQILEFYAATEGNFSLYNAEGRPGAIGRIPPFLAHRFATALVKRDETTGAPARNQEGFCIAAARGETGEAIGKIAGGATRFEGYTDEAANEKKILRGVFKPGDAWVRTGDLMRQDGQGFFYFVDRVGDTFRWKGENVSTTEVAAALSDYPGVVTANVYGVSVPGADGRAGMAALETDGSFDLSGLGAHLRARLPDYAQPVFLRLSQSLALTETFKLKKQDLARDGFDPAKTSDPLFCNVGEGYVPLDATLYARISAGLIRI
jgi:fatty-acyl-CoA synthase